MGRDPDAPALPARLTDPWYDASFITDIGADGQSFRAHHDVPISQAQGLWMCCPCGGGHAIEVPFANPPCGIPVPADFGPWDRAHTHHPRWTVSGTSLADLTISPSIDVGELPACWHGYVTDGEVR